MANVANQPAPMISRKDLIVNETASGRKGDLLDVDGFVQTLARPRLRGPGPVRKARFYKVAVHDRDVLN